MNFGSKPPHLTGIKTVFSMNYFLITITLAQTPSSHLTM